MVDSQGVIYPGLIDLHNHPEYAIYPLLPHPPRLPRPLRMALVQRRVQQAHHLPQVVLAQPQYLGLALEIGRYGEYKALAGARPACKAGATVLWGRKSAWCNAWRTRGWSPRPPAGWILGRSARSGPPCRMNVPRPLVGIWPRPVAQWPAEFTAIRRATYWARLIAIHGVGLTAPQLQEMATAGANWCSRHCPISCCMARPRRWRLLPSVQACPSAWRQTGALGQQVQPGGTQGGRPGQPA